MLVCCLAGCARRTSGVPAQADDHPRLQVDDRVRVESSGATVTGTVVRLTPDLVVLDADSVRHSFGPEEVGRVEVGRSRTSRYARRGAVIVGLGVGATTAVLASELCSGSTDCGGELYAKVAVITLLGAGVGGVIGAAIGSSAVAWEPASWGARPVPLGGGRTGWEVSVRFATAAPW